MSIEAMKQALEALENCTTWHLTREQFDKNVTAITALRTAIEQAEKQEPVAWAEGDEDGNIVWSREDCFSDDPEWLDNPMPLYTASPTYDQGWKDGYKHGAWANTAAPVQELWKQLPKEDPPLVKWASAQRQWVGLTTDEMKEVADRYHLKPPNVPVAFRAIEAKLREKNGGQA